MNDYTIPERTVDWGDYLAWRIDEACKRAGLTKSALFVAVGKVIGQSRNTIADLVKYAEVPPAESKDATRAVALLLAINESPESFGLSVDELPPLMRKAGPAWIRAEVRKWWVAGESNPEPADSGQISRMTCVRA